MRIINRLSLGLFALILFGCNSNSVDSEKTYTPKGTYQHVADVSGTALTIQVEFTGELYEFKGYLGSGIGSTCQIAWELGYWKIEANKFKMSKRTEYHRADCTTAFSAMASEPDESQDIRNMFETSFELYEAGGVNSPAQWVKYTKI